MALEGSDGAEGRLRQAAIVGHLQLAGAGDGEGKTFVLHRWGEMQRNRSVCV